MWALRPLHSLGRTPGQISHPMIADSSISRCCTACPPAGGQVECYTKKTTKYTLLQVIQPHRLSKVLTPHRRRG